MSLSPIHSSSSLPLSFPTEKPIISGPKLIEFDDVRADLIDFTRGLINRALQLSSPSTNRTFIHNCGLSGAGKSTHANELASQDPSFVIVGNDRVMFQIPGYQQDCQSHGLSEAFSKWELPARAIGYHLLQALVEAGRNIIYDHSATSRDHITLINKLKVQGYRVEMHYIPCSEALCLARIQARPNITGQYTPLSFVEERAKVLEELLPIYKEITEFREIDSNRSFEPV